MGAVVIEFRRIQQFSISTAATNLIDFPLGGLIFSIASNPTTYTIVVIFGFWFSIQPNRMFAMNSILLFYHLIIQDVLRPFRRLYNIRSVSLQNRAVDI